MGGSNMTTIEIEDIKFIGIDSFPSETKIDFEQESGSTTRIELSTKDARYLAEELHKKVFDKSEQPETLWERIHELEAVNLVLEDRLKRKGGKPIDG
jgi:hypothetical protein